MAINITLSLNTTEINKRQHEAVTTLIAEEAPKATNAPVATFHKTAPTSSPLNVEKEDSPFDLTTAEEEEAPKVTKTTSKTNKPATKTTTKTTPVIEEDPFDLTTEVATPTVILTETEIRQKCVAKGPGKTAAIRELLKEFSINHLKDLKDSDQPAFLAKLAAL